MNKFILLLLTSVVSLQVYSNDYAFELDGIYYLIDGDEAIVTRGPFDILAKNDAYDNEEYSRDYVGDVVIPEAIVYEDKEYPVTAIDQYSFWMCWDLTSVTIPPSVVSIGEEAFSDCIGLQSIEIPGSVKSIGDRIFARCQGLEAIYGEYASEDHRLLIMNGEIKGVADHGLTTCIVPDNVTYIGSLAFADCRFTSIELPESVIEIGGSAFAYCHNLTSVTIPDSVTKIGNHAFSPCRALESVHLPENLNEIPPYCFEYCEKLKSIDIPNSVIKIGYGAFEDCKSLETVTIPESVAAIEWRAFSKCEGLQSVTVRVADPDVIAMDPGVFNKCNLEECVLRVPAGSADLYRKAEQWKDFKNIVEIPDAAVQTLEQTDDRKPIIYDLTGTKVTLPRDGRIYIVNGKKSLFRK